MYRVFIVLLACVLGFTFYDWGRKKDLSLNIGMNLWPGYALIFLAQEKGFFEDENLDVKISEIGSLSDILRAFERRQLDVFASTLVEVLEVEAYRPERAKIVLFTDFSNGEDVILSVNPNIKQMSDMRGKKLGFEESSLGLYVANLGIKTANLNTDHLQFVPTGQLDAWKKLNNGDIDAMATYPPFSTSFIKDGAHVIYSSAQTPYEILDTVSIRKDLLEKYPYLSEKFMNVWQRTYQYWRDNPEESTAIMARQLGLSVEELNESLKGVVVMDKMAQRTLVKRQELETVFKNMVRVSLNATQRTHLTSLHHLVAVHLED